MSAEEVAAKERGEREIWEQLAARAEQSRAEVVGELLAMQAAASQEPKRVAQFIAQAETASAAISLDEAATRDLIDEQLRKRGW